MIRDLQAVNTYVLIIRDEAETETGGLLLPDQAQIKPAMGKIISVGEKVTDSKIIIGKKAIFNKHAGFSIEINGEEVTVLQGGEENSQILAVI